MRWLGAILIVLAGLCSGAIYSGEKKQRLRGLEDICTALELMSGELQTRLSSLPELCNELKDRSEGAVQIFFNNLSKSFNRLGETEFSSLWDENARENLKILNDEELRQVSSLGKVLGRCEVERQLEALTSVISYMRTSLENARKTYPQEKKLGLGVGTAAALLLALVLL